MAGKQRQVPSYSVFSPSYKKYTICCENCRREYYYKLSDADVCAVKDYYTGKASLSSVAGEGVRIAEKFNLCQPCFMDAREDEYRNILYRAGNRFKPMVEDYVYGIGRLEDLKLWLGDALASAIEEFKEKYVSLD